MERKKSKERKGNPVKNENKEITEMKTVEQEKETESPERDHCFICAEKVKLWAVGDCGHRFCYLCCLRLRVLYKSDACPMCKTTNTQVLITISQDEPFNSLWRPGFPFNKEFSVYFADKMVESETLWVLDWNCPVSKCGSKLSSKAEMRRHVSSIHSLSFCEICFQHKRIFSHEMQTFTSKSLTVHTNFGDESFKGHPKCDFCCMSFYSSDELYEHCREKHETCHLCERSGIRHVYYRNYSHLQDHFHNEHFLCPDPACIEKKFMVFEDEIAYKAHMAESHLTALKGQRSYQRQLRSIDAGFEFNLRESKSPPRRMNPRNHGQSSSSNRREGVDKSSDMEKEKLRDRQRGQGRDERRAQINSISTESPTTPQPQPSLSNAFSAVSLGDRGRKRELMNRIRNIIGSDSIFNDIGVHFDSFLSSELNIIEFSGKVTLALGIPKSLKLFPIFAELTDASIKKNEFSRQFQDLKALAQDFPDLAPATTTPNRQTGSGPRVLLIKDHPISIHRRPSPFTVKITTKAQAQDVHDFPTLTHKNSNRSVSSKTATPNSIVGWQAFSESLSGSYAPIANTIASNGNFHRDNPIVKNLLDRSEFPSLTGSSRGVSLPEHSVQEERETRREIPGWDDSPESFVIGSVTPSEVVGKEKKGKKKGKTVLLHFG